MADRQKLIVHIGLEKTGTSSFQACLHRNGATLERHGFLYPRRNAAYGWTNHKHLVGCYEIDTRGDPWLRVDGERRHTTVESLIGEIEARDDCSAIISSEHLSARFRDWQIAQFRTDFDCFDCRVLVVVRDHLARLCSLYVSHVVNGGILPFAEFAASKTHPDALDLRYADLIAPWSRAFGRRNIELVPYGAEVVSLILARIDPALAKALAAKAYRANVSVGADEAAAMQLVNAAAAGAGGGSTATRWVRQNCRRLQVRRWLRGAARDGRPSTWSVPSELLARLATIVDSDRARLESMFDFTCDSGPPAIAAATDADARAAATLARTVHAQLSRPWGRAGVA